MAQGRVGNRETEVELKDMDGDYGRLADPILQEQQTQKHYWLDKIFPAFFNANRML